VPCDRLSVEVDRRYVEDPASASSSNLLDDPVIPGSAPPPTNALVAIVEMGLGGLATDDRVRVGLVSVVPPTGEVVWDEFDGRSRKPADQPRLTARLASTKRARDATDTPCSRRVASAGAGPQQSYRKGSGALCRRGQVGATLAESELTLRSGTEYAVRVERIDKIASYSSAFDYLTKFYNAKDARSKSGETDSNEIDMTGDSPAGDNVDQDGDIPMTASQAEKEADTMELASGLPGELASISLSANLQRKKRSWRLSTSPSRSSSPFALLSST